MTHSIEALREQLLQLQRLNAAGVLDAAQYEASKTPLERRLLDAVLAAGSAGAASPAPAGAAAAAGALPAADSHRASAGLWATAAAAVVLIAAAGYWWAGSPGDIGQAPAGFAAASGAASPADGAASAPHQLGREQMDAMVGKLAARMQEQPDDAEGWGMLGRSYMALGRHAEAIAAYQRALKLKPNDATTIADYADALAVKNDRTLDGEPTQLIERALKLDPDNVKALALAGTAAFNRGDYAAAVRHWDRAVKVGPADSGMVQMARNGAAEARERGKLPPAAETTAPAPATAPAAAAAQLATPAAAAAGISGTVRLAASLKAQAAPEDAVFIFARPAQGTRMPLAILRKQVKDLPFDFKLDDSLAMSPAARLSGAGSVIVGARISKSGQAMPQAGDLEGLSAPVAVGASGVIVEIGTRVP